MGLKRIARLGQVCGNCFYFNCKKEICNHIDMKKEKVTADMLEECLNKHFKSKDDYETRGR